MKIQEALTFGKNFLRNNIQSYDIDAKLLLMDILKIDKIALLTSLDEISDDNFSLYKIYLNRRINYEPVAYIIGHIFFMDYIFFVNSSVLIPRGDTEILVYKALEVIEKYNFNSHLDIGSGTGCIPISLCLMSNIKSLGIDISTEALEVFQKNITFHKLDKRVKILESDLFSNLDLSTKYDLITSNPPYITSTEMTTLMNDVKDYEPHLALHGGNDGLKFYKDITSTAYNLLNPGGYLIYEIGYNQGKDVENILLKNNFISIEILNDLNNKNRVVLGRKNICLKD